MRRMLFVLLTLAGLSRGTLEAQTCHGLAPLPTGQLQATGAGMLRTGSRSVAVGLISDLPAGAFGAVQLGTTAMEAFEKSSLDLAASLGYQLDLDGAGRTQLCPMASTTLQLGPNNAFGSGVGRTTFSAGLGLAAGTSLQLRPLLSLVPAIGLGVGHRTHRAESSAGSQLFRIDETYGFAQLQVGVVINQHLSIRPSIELPLGLEGGNMGLGLTVGYHFGRRNPPGTEP
jgi:hypothetical protein